VYRELALGQMGELIFEVTHSAVTLSEAQRAILAAVLLGSLPSVLHDDDEGIQEALRRDAEFEVNPALGLSPADLDQKIQDRRS